jgi:hypothetical protein
MKISALISFAASIPNISNELTAHNIVQCLTRPEKRNISNELNKIRFTMHPNIT